MAKIFGKEYPKEQLMKKTGSLSQVCGIREFTSNSGRAKGVDAIDMDADISFCKLTKFKNNFNHSYPERGVHILELKYKTKDDPDMHRITSGLPFRITRSSKYIAGVDQVYI